MKVKMIRASGNPVDPQKADEYANEWKTGFDELTEKYGKYGPEINEALDVFEKDLQFRYNDLTVLDVVLPKTKKAWVELMSEYGNVMVTTCIEDGKFAKSGDLLLIINDMVF